MRLAPKHWRTEAWWCSMKGHVTPAATVAELTPADSELGIVTPGGSRLCRCLRCDDWVDHAPPTNPTSERLPPPDDLPRPLRGRALDEQVVVRAIALERGLHVFFFGLVAVLLIVVEWGLPGLRESASDLLATAQGIVAGSRPGNTLLVKGLAELSELTSQRALLLIAVCVGYAVLEGVEAVFLWRGKRWAEYLTVVATAALLPLAISALAEKVTVLRVFGLLLDLAILAYLVWTKRLFGVRGGQRRLEAELAADVDWHSLHRTAPVRT